MAESPSKLFPLPPTPMPTPGVQAPPATERRPRRPRAREVSSRYLSASPSSSSSSSSEQQHLAASPRNAYPPPSPFKKHHQHPQPRSRPFSSDPEGVDENRPPASARRSSSQTPLVPNPATAKPPVTLKNRTVVRLFADNNATSSSLSEDPADPRRRPRPGTPMVPHPLADGFGGGVKVHHRPPTPVRVSLFPSEKGDCGRGSGDNRLDETSSENSFSDSEICSVSNQGGFCDSPPLLPPVSCRLRPVEVRSSMPEADLLPTMSARRGAEACSGQQEATDDSSCRASTNSLCLRSLNSAIAGRQQQHPFNLSKSVSRPLFLMKPPQPPTTTKSVTDTKGRKASTRQEEIHSLRLRYNNHLQCRFINAKTEATTEVRTIAAEKSLLGLSARTLELRNSVAAKRIDLEQSKRREALSSISQSQMPHLEEWSILEDDYSSSLSGATKALQNASLRLPVTGDVRVDIREIKKVLDSTILVLELSSSHMAKFLPKAEDIKVVASDLASIISMQKSLIEECGNLLSEAHRLQVMECSLRSYIMQKKQSQM